MKSFLKQKANTLISQTVVLYLPSQNLTILGGVRATARAREVRRAGSTGRVRAVRRAGSMGRVHPIHLAGSTGHVRVARPPMLTEQRAL